MGMFSRLFRKQPDVQRKTRSGEGRGVIRTKHVLFFIIEGSRDPILCAIVRRNFVSAMKQEGDYFNEDHAAKDAAIILFQQTFPTGSRETEAEVHHIVEQNATVKFYERTSEILEGCDDEAWEVPVCLVAWPAPGINRLFDTLSS